MSLLMVFISVSSYRAFHRPQQQLLTAIAAMQSLHTVQHIPLAGEITSDKTEISGMAWYGDLLILVPQYPHRLGKTRNGKLFAIQKADIISYLDGTSTGPLEPIAIPINSQIFRGEIKGFEGFEAIAFSGNQAYLTIEASGPMKGYLATGTLDPDLMSLTLDPNIVEIPLQARIDNFADEALVIFQNKLYTFYEANGINDNPQPVAHSFNLDLEPLDTLPMPAIEYRLTDASAPDENGVFWVLNYFFWGDFNKIKPGEDQLSPGRASVSILPLPVERLVQLKITENGIILGDHAPIRLAIAENGFARNWEALASLDDRGFLVATDKYPDTILAFISY
jgi:hypothetical protein